MNLVKGINKLVFPITIVKVSEDSTLDPIFVGASS